MLQRMPATQSKCRIDFRARGKFNRQAITGEPKHHLRWLFPENTEFRRSLNGQFEVWVDGEQLGSSVFVVQAFPATHPNEYLCIRGLDHDGEEIEFGMIRDLTQWSSDYQACVRESLKRRYLMREIVRFHRIVLKYGFLDLDVETTTGRCEFSMRWTSSQALDFGEEGKLLIDTKRIAILFETFANSLMPSKSFSCNTSTGSRFSCPLPDRAIQATLPLPLLNLNLNLT